MSIDQRSKPALLLAALVGVALLFGAWFFMRHVTPDQVMSELFDLNAPTRYAFVSEADGQSVAVIDVIQGQQVGQLALEAVPEFWSLSASSGQLLYAPQDSDSVYFYNTSTHQSRQQALGLSLAHWQYHDASTQLFYADQHSVGALNIRTGSALRLEQRLSDIQAIFYDPFLQVLWVLDQGVQAMVAWTLSDNQIAFYALPEGWHDFSPLAITPDGRYLIFAAADDAGVYHGVFWSLPARRIEGTVGQWSAPIIQPYVDSNGRYAWLFAQAGEGLRVAVDDLSDTTAFNEASAEITAVASGWLDQRLLLASAQGLELRDSKTAKMISQHSLPNRVQDVFITADSKTALITVRDEAALYAYGLRDGALKRLDVQGISAADKVIMGASNTLCH